MKMQANGFRGWLRKRTVTGYFYKKHVYINRKELMSVLLSCFIYRLSPLLCECKKAPFTNKLFCVKNKNAITTNDICTITNVLI